MQPPHFLRHWFPRRESAAKEIRRLHWRLQVSLFCFSSHTVKGQSLKFLVEKRYTLHTVAVKIGFQETILEILPELVSINKAQLTGSLRCLVPVSHQPRSPTWTPNHHYTTQPRVEVRTRRRWRQNLEAPRWAWVWKWWSSHHAPSNRDRPIRRSLLYRYRSQTHWTCPHSKPWKFQEKQVTGWAQTKITYYS